MATALFFAVGFIVSSVGESTGWRGTVFAWAGWAFEPWFAALFLLASFVAWYSAKACRIGLSEACEDSQLAKDESGYADASGVVQLWDRARRAVVIAGVAALPAFPDLSASRCLSC